MSGGRGERGRPAVALLSGGLDSATALAIAVERGYEVYALTLHYGQRHAVEVERAARLARALGAEEHRLVELDLTFLRGSALTDSRVAVPVGRSNEELGEGIPPTYVPARNTILLSLALAWAETLSARDIFIGVNAVDYSGYPDCRPVFIETFGRLAGLATKAGAEGAVFRIHAPLLRLTKSQIILRAVELGVDLGEAVSCYQPGPKGRPCGGCDACLLRAKGFREAGIPDPALG
jgi:7-cyano-7-deazaguanine synthase